MIPSASTSFLGIGRKMLAAEAQERLMQRDPGTMASRAAFELMHTAGEWDPPAGARPKRDLLHFSIGIPDSAALPRAAITAAMHTVLAANDDAAFRYGLGAGYFPLRAWLAGHYAQERSYGMDADWFQITNGSSGAIDLVVRSLIDPGDVIIAEAPTYMGTLHNFRGVQAQVHTVPVDGQGLNTDALRASLAALRAAGQRVKLIYTISAFQNPTGVTLALERRAALLELAAEHNCYVLDDEAYRELWFIDPPPPPLIELSRGHGVITVGSFSKILATGLRVGWIHAHPDLLQLFRRMRFAMGQNQIGLRMVANLVGEGHLAPHLRAMRGLYHDKMRRTAVALERHAGEYLRFERPTGGFYLWCALRKPLTAQHVWRLAYEEGVALNAGGGFHPERREPDGEHLRIAYAWIPAADIDEAARRLGIACARAAAEQPR